MLISEKKQSKRTKILDAAFELFVSKSVHSTAIDDVVRLAGVAKGTFYLYFKDKYDLLNQIVAYKSAGILEDAVAHLDRESREGMPLSVRGVILADYIMDYFVANPALSALMNKNFSACFNLLLQNGNESFRRTVDRLLEGLVSAGYEPQEAKKTLYLLTDMTGSACFDAINGNGPFSLGEIRPLLHTFILNALEHRIPAEE